MRLASLTQLYHVDSTFQAACIRLHESKREEILGIFQESQTFWSDVLQKHSDLFLPLIVDLSRLTS